MAADTYTRTATNLLKTSFGFSELFEDPISFEIMVDATSTPCGHSFSAQTVPYFNNNFKLI